MYALGNALKVAKRVDGAVVDVGDDVALLHSAALQESATIDRGNLHTTLDVERLAEALWGILEFCAKHLDSIDAILAEEARLATPILECGNNLQLLIPTT